LVEQNLKKKMSCEGNCEEQIYTCDMGKCKRCSADISSGMMKLCEECANKTDSCQFCGKKKQLKECKGHEENFFTCDIGKCTSCGGDTESGSFCFCQECSIKKGVCHICGGTKNLIE
jgi:hypothetical protein